MVRGQKVLQLDWNRSIRLRKIACQIDIQSLPNSTASKDKTAAQRVDYGPKTHIGAYDRTHARTHEMQPQLD